MTYTKEFNGVTYKFGGSYASKRDAEYMANDFRKKGGKARIVKTSRGYDMYTKK